MLKKFSIIGLAIALSAVTLFAQDAQLRSAVAGQKYKIKGVVVNKIDDTTYIINDSVGVDTKIVVSPSASIKNNAFFGGDKYPVTALVKGLTMEVEGVGDSSGSVLVNKVRFEKANLVAAQALDKRVAPVEERVTAAEQNAQRVSGQIDELMAISNAAKGGAKAAQETADAAIAGVNETNKRISTMDDYVIQSTATVNFKVNSAVLSTEAKASLDQVAATAKTLKGYVIDVTGYASAEGDTKKNKALSQRRALAVKEYLIENHDIDLRRFPESYGFGELKAVADNTTREGREQNRRVEVKLLVNRGLNTNVEIKTSN
ncbi:MAG: OmpA family protein [Pyrinomonadaceae bacterium]|jgi:outer membrane protein OmpA-like peptidoglycan-associated protein|nr:OmpA family protein [Pyrinomonadaceae bacterium]MBP9109289.1 OmpA family protein [Pyrinomonadaceae bacterium]